MVIAMPRASAFGSVRSASRISSPMLAATHQPPKEKKAATVAPPSAGKKRRRAGTLGDEGDEVGEVPGPADEAPDDQGAQGAELQDRREAQDAVPDPQAARRWPRPGRGRTPIATTFCAPAVSGTMADT